MARKTLSRATALTDEALECRGDSRHNLQPWKVSRWRTFKEHGRKLIEIRRTCRTCFVERVDVWTEQMRELVRRHYNYPEGYKPEGEGGIDRGEIRAELTRRFMPEELR